MAGGSKRESISVQDLQEWLGALGLEVEPEDERPLPDQLRDGVVLCQLVNRIKPNSVEVVGDGRGGREAMDWGGQMDLYMHLEVGRLLQELSLCRLPLA